MKCSIENFRRLVILGQSPPTTNVRPLLQSHAHMLRLSIYHCKCMSVLRLVLCGLSVRHKFKLITFWWPFSNNFLLFPPQEILFFAGEGEGGYLCIGVSKLNYGRKAAVPYCGQQSLASLLPLPNLLTFLRARLLHKGSDSFFKNKMCYLLKATKKQTKNRKRKL